MPSVFGHLDGRELKVKPVPKAGFCILIKGGGNNKGAGNIF
jgi:hypothetical protein